MSEIKKIHLFTHTDLDGVGCAIVANVFVRSHSNYSLDITFCENSDVDDKVQKFLESSHASDNYESCYITDLSVNGDTAAMISESPLNIHLLDHHVSSMWLNEYSWALSAAMHPIHKYPTCGTELLYETLFSDAHNPRLEEFVNDVRLWDTWAWKESGSTAPQIYSSMLRLKGISKFMNEILPKLYSSVDVPLDWVVTFSEENERKENYIRDKMNQLLDVCFEGLRFKAVIANEFISELGNRISEAYPEYAGAVMLTEYSISMRTTRSDVNLADIAKKHGGGGHPQAAGISLDTSDILNMIYTVLDDGEAGESDCNSSDPDWSDK